MKPFKGLKLSVMLILVMLPLEGWSQGTSANPQQPSFSSWLPQFKHEAAQAGISESTLGLLDKAQLDPRVVDLDRRQPEAIQPLAVYMNKRIESVLEGAQKRLKQHKTLLSKVAKQYKIHPELIVALWGVETHFGQITGNFPVIPSLMTLAYDERRPALFRKELMACLLAIDQKLLPHKNPLTTLKGSWAGAMGQCQFMPSHFLNKAVDYDKSGDIDLWNSLPDVFASIGNFLQGEGWQQEAPWGWRVTLPKDFDPAWIDINHPQPIEVWRKRGFKKLEGPLKIAKPYALPKTSYQVALICPDGPDRKSAQRSAYLVFPNFMILMKWNKSQRFGITVGTIVDRLKKGYPKKSADGKLSYGHYDSVGKG